MLLLLACAADPAVLDSATTTPDVDTRLPPAELATISGTCPEIVDGEKVSFTSNGMEREVKVLLPDAVEEGMPVIFAWHPLGVSTRQLISYIDLDGWAKEQGVIVVVPESDPDNLFDWDFWNGEEDDFILYDDMRTCLSDTYGIDLRRVYTTGMSAGGLMTTALSIQRGDTFAAILPMSGGTDPVIEYSTPAYPFPALLTYGGDTDTWGGGGFDLDFQAATLAFAEALDADDHLVVTCNHNGGHDFPPNPTDYLRDWLLPHVFGEASPYENDISALPDICATWDGSLLEEDTGA